jgi:tetratricopeptide (TPR) repeat protein
VIATVGTQGTKDEALQNTRQLLARDPESAERQARIIIEGDAECIDAHTLLGLALRRQGRTDEALISEQRAIDLSMLQPTVFEALMTLSLQQLDKSERAARTVLETHPENAAGMRLLAEVAARMGQLDEAERLLRRALTVAPSYELARSLLARIERARAILGNGKTLPDRGITELIEPSAGETPTDEALHVYEIMAQEHSDNAELLVSYGHLLRTIGSQDKAVERYRQAIAVKPTFGEAWYAIGDLKASRYSPEDVTELQHLAQSDVRGLDRAQILFALGRALEQFGDYPDSFEAYAEANRLRSTQTDYDAAVTARHVDHSCQVFDADYFARRAGAGELSKGPVFILGMPRAGSTLLEQILASHSQIEPTGELTDIANIANSLSQSEQTRQDSAYDPEAVARLPQSDLLRLGRGYLWNAGLRRRTKKLLFIDKMPNNWLHLGFILSILPNAKIIDARRHPMACCFSNFRQNFVAGQEFTYDLNDIGRFYRDYVRMMAHFDEVVPGRVYRVIHERLVANPDEEVRRMLDFVGVEFEESCLRFYENKRAVRTASSEQVRRPINREGLDQWRNFDPWLGDLRQALGPIVDSYPDVPAALVDGSA